MITLILYAIAAHCGVGGCIAPGVRLIAAWAGVSQGIVSDCLYDLARDGWISYDGRVIMLLRDPDSDDDHGDRFAADRCDDRSFEAAESDDRCIDRSHADMVLTTTDSESINLVVVESQIPCGAENDQRADHPPPAAQIMAELGANPKIIHAAYESRPDWTPEQVRQRWEYDQQRIAASDGRLHEGVFFTALRNGELAPARPDPARPLDPQSYAGTPGFALGGALEPPDGESIRDHALRLLGPWTAENHQAQIRDSVFLQTRIGMGDSDADALAALDVWRLAVRR